MLARSWSCCDKKNSNVLLGGRNAERISAVRRRINIEVIFASVSLLAFPFSTSFGEAFGCRDLRTGFSNSFRKVGYVSRSPGLTKLLEISACVLIRSLENTYTMVKNSCRSFCKGVPLRMIFLGVLRAVMACADLFLSVFSRWPDYVSKLHFHISWKFHTFVGNNDVNIRLLKFAMNLLQFLIPNNRNRVCLPPDEISQVRI